ncbi:GLUG motif-containing protein [Trinickia dinghuensis]
MTRPVDVRWSVHEYLGAFAAHAAGGHVTNSTSSGNSVP